MVAAGLGCTNPVTEDGFFFQPNTPHERYEHAFRRVGLEKTALGYEWIRTSQRALEEAHAVEPPFHETGYFDPRQAHAVGYRLTLERGQLLKVTGELNGTVFVDLFRVEDRLDERYDHAVSADEDSLGFQHLVRRSGEYVLRLQPEILAGGRYEVRIIAAPSLEFPVLGHDMGAIRSRFGAPRDGGRRDHHGVDIFAPRGTPVIAAARGQVRSTRPSGLGGNVVWLRTEAGNLYYAHLDSVSVRRGMSVRVGDTVGFVGNTGNARTTPPHLHFGVYSRGPSDPEPYLFRPPQDPPPLVADAELVGNEVRVSSDRTGLLGAPTSRADVIEQLRRFTPLRVLGGTSRYLRVVLPTGVVGFVDASKVESVIDPLERQVLAIGRRVLANPLDTLSVVGTLPQGEEVLVHGQFGRYLYVVANGRRGWMVSDLAGPQDGGRVLTGSPAAVVAAPSDDGSR